MKTAEDWNKTCPVLFEGNPKSFLDWVKEIQLDAYKQGMTDAAEIAVNTKPKSDAKHLCTAHVIISYQIKTTRDAKQNL